MKGLIDIIYIPIIIFITIIGIIVSFEVAKNLKNAISNSPIEVEETIKVFDTIETFTPYLIIAIYFALPIAAVVLAVISGGETILTVLAFSFLLISAFLSIVFKNILIETIPSLEHFYNLYSSNVILQNLIVYFPFIMFIFGLIILIAQYIYR